MKITKRLPALLIAIVMILAIVPFSASADSFPFRDVKDGEWYYPYVRYVYENGYMVGVSAKTFEPEGKLTRAMLVTILCKLSGGTPGITNDFKDVPAGQWYAPYVGWAAKTGVVKGYGGGIFKPENNITREEMAVAMVRYVDYADLRLPRQATAPYNFADKAKISDWALDYVEVLRKAGIMNGDTAKKYNPASDITRAEIATVIKNFNDAADKAWQGYLPDPDADGYAVYGAKYLYNTGFSVQGKMITDLDADGAYPALKAYPITDEYYCGVDGMISVEPDGTTGFSPTAVIADLTKTPYVKVCYSYVGADAPDSIDAFLSTRTASEVTYKSAPLEFVRGADDEGSITAICDATAAVGAIGAEFGTGTGQNVHVMLRPYDDPSIPTDSFRLRYVALFSTLEDAEAFKSAELGDYLNGYFLTAPSKVEETDISKLDEYLAIMRDRINEIKTSESEITPEKIKAAGGTCYYVSSINGDDSNDGLSPETPFKTVDALFRYHQLAGVYMSLAKEGDGVFFERGSEFYPSRYYNNTTSSLPTHTKTSYGAYGDPSKPKPVFYGSFDFGGGTGHWEPTEWEDVYVLDLYEYLPAEKADHFSKRAGQIGGIVFNEGQYRGVHIVADNQMTDENSDDPPATFGEDVTTVYKHYQSNYDEYFISGGTTCLDPGDALRHNLEYIHDYPTGKVYLRCKWGDPDDVFDRIDVCRNCNICFAEKGVNLDNLAFLYSGYICVDLGNGGGRVTWCEAGYAGGNTSSVGTGIGGFGKCDSIYIGNCYVHDIEDGPVGTQYTGDFEGEELNNVVCEDNVITTSEDIIELFSTKRVEGEDGLGKNKIRNAIVRNNIAAYLGYGYSNACEGFCEGLAVHNYFYGEMVDCELYDNLMICSNGCIIGAHVASDGNPRGWFMHDNTYVLNPKLCGYLCGTDGVTYTNLKKSFYTSYKSPYTDRYIGYFNSIGIDIGSTYYSYEETTEAERLGYYYTSSWYIERGLTP